VHACCIVGILLGGCGTEAGQGESVGTAAIAITDAPADGTCIQVTATGFRTVTSSFDVPAGHSTVFLMKGLPLGTVIFSGAAFGGTCASLAMGAVPNWVSDPVTTTVAVSPPVNVTLAMHRNGRANVSVDFPNEPADGGPPDATLACGTGSGAVDQSQLLSSGDYVVSAQQVVGQSFVAGQTGTLAGIEVGTDACNGVDPQASMTLTVLSNGMSLGTSSIGATAIPVGGCGSNPLSATMVGPGFFDLGAQCIPVTAGQSLTFQLTIVSPTVPRCNTTTGLCTSGVAGNPCFQDSDCGYAPRVGLQGTNAYANGTAFVNGTAQPMFDLSFKTFVR
jgi:hypothetical protein